MARFEQPFLTSAGNSIELCQYPSQEEGKLCAVLKAVSGIAVSLKKSLRMIYAVLYHSFSSEIYLMTDELHKDTDRIFFMLIKNYNSFSL